METTRHTQLPHYTYRNGHGPTLVLLHYWGGSSRTWDAVTDHLPDRSLLTLDLRGWGQSRKLPGPYNLDQLAADTVAVIADAGVTDFVLVGHSMGGKVALLVAATQPKGLRGLILVAPAPAEPAPAVTAEYREALAHAYDTDESVATARDHILTATPLAADLKTQVTEDSRASAPDAHLEWPLRGIAEDITAKTRLIGTPVLIVAGEHDQVEPIEVLREHLLPFLARARAVVLPAVGHLIPLEAPESLADLIVSFAAGT